MSSQFELIVEILEQLSTLLEDLQQSEKPRNLDQLVEFSNPRNSDKWAQVWGHEDQVKGDDGEQIDDEPSF